MLQNIVMLSVVYAENPFMPSVIMLNVIMLFVVVATRTLHN